MWQLSSYVKEYQDNLNWLSENTELMSDEDYITYKNAKADFVISEDFKEIVKLRQKLNGDYKKSKEVELQNNLYRDKINNKKLSLGLLKEAETTRELAVQSLIKAKRSGYVVTKEQIVEESGYYNWCIRVSKAVKGI
mgnify:CR=1 FL=1